MRHALENTLIVISLFYQVQITLRVYCALITTTTTHAAQLTLLLPQSEFFYCAISGVLFLLCHCFYHCCPAFKNHSLDWNRSKSSLAEYKE